MKDSEYVEEYEINDYFELQDIIQGRGDHIDLREKCIFRGVSRKCYKLIPSSLRGFNIAHYIDADYAPGIRLRKKDALELNLSVPEDMDDAGYEVYNLNKKYEFDNGRGLDDAFSLNQFKALQELFVINKFLDDADKEGLKVPIPQEVRKKIHSRELEIPYWWPEKGYYEIISLAQHYDLPTRALDWSYDFKVSLYFAVNNILVDNNTECYENNDGLLWAFNYRYFQGNFDIDDDSFKLKFYRPEYYTNPNLSAQKGLFTFNIDSKWNCDERSVDELIIHELENHKSEVDGEYVYNIPGLMSFTIPENEKIFYKFIIPEDMKAEILNQLYHEGYSEKSLFPGYKGVTRNIKNKAKLDEILGRY